jgi:hypothetical protein
LRAVSRFALVCSLAALVASCREQPTEDVGPLLPGDAMSYWKAASPAQKQATAELLIGELREGGALGAKTSATLVGPDDVRRLAAELAAALDEATQIDHTAYVSPGQSMRETARQIAFKRRWNE